MIKLLVFSKSITLQTLKIGVTTMKNLTQLMEEIIQLTTEIETKYPELYQYLDETPISICDTKVKTICTDDLKEYLETLKSQLQHHLETHKK